MPLSELFGFHESLGNQYAEIICKNSLGLRKNAAHQMKDMPWEVSFYDRFMRHWIKAELGVDIPCIKDVMEKSCWGCGEEKDDLKHCKGKINSLRILLITMTHFAVCKIPKYCSTECQKLDWIEGGHKVLHKMYREQGGQSWAANY